MTQVNSTRSSNPLFRELVAKRYMELRSSASLGTGGRHLFRRAVSEVETVFLFLEELEKGTFRT